MTTLVTERDLGLRIGVAVRRYRERAGLTQVDLADMAKVAQSEISLIEGGKRSKLATLDRVAQALSQRLSDLLRFAEDVGDAKTVVSEARAFVAQVRKRRGIGAAGISHEVSEKVSLKHGNSDE